MDLYTKPTSEISPSSNLDEDPNPSSRTAAGTNGINPAFNDITSVAHDVVDKLSENVSDIDHSISQQVARLRDASIKSADATRGYVRSNPLRSLAYAAGVGLLAGLLLRLR